MSTEQNSIRQAARHLLLVNGVIPANAPELTANDLATCPVHLADRLITGQIIRRLAEWPVGDNERCTHVLKVAEGIGVSTDAWNDSVNRFGQLLMRCSAEYLIGIWGQAARLSLTHYVAQALAKPGRDDLDQEALLTLIRNIESCPNDDTERVLVDALVNNAGCSKEQLVALFIEKATTETRSQLNTVASGSDFGRPLLENLSNHHKLSVIEWLRLLTQAADDTSRWFINSKLLGHLEERVAMIAEVTIPKKDAIA